MSLMSLASAVALVLLTSTCYVKGTFTEEVSCPSSDWTYNQDTNTCFRITDASVSSSSSALQVCPYLEPGVVTNVALNQPVTLNSEYEWYPPQNAVDGNYLTGAQSTDTANPWLQVDLGQSYLVEFVKIWNRFYCCRDRLSNAELQVIDSTGPTTKVCATIPEWENSGPHMATFICDEPLKGDKFKIQSVGFTGVFHTDEVEVYAATANVFNIAFGKTVTMSTYYHLVGVALPQNAVDGGFSGTWGQCAGSSAYPNERDVDNNWFEIDLAGKFQIQSVKLWSRTDGSEANHLPGFELQIINSGTVQTCHTNTDTTWGAEHSRLFECGETLIGDVFRLRKTNNNEIAVCEIEVYGQEVPWKTASLASLDLESDRQFVLGNLAIPSDVGVYVAAGKYKNEGFFWLNGNTINMTSVVETDGVAGYYAQCGYLSDTGVLSITEECAVTRKALCAFHPGVNAGAECENGALAFHEPTGRCLKMSAGRSGTYESDDQYYACNRMDDHIISSDVITIDNNALTRFLASVRACYSGDCDSPDNHFVGLLPSRDYTDSTLMNFHTFASSDAYSASLQYATDGVEDQSGTICLSSPYRCFHTQKEVNAWFLASLARTVYVGAVRVQERPHFERYRGLRLLLANTNFVNGYEGTDAKNAPGFRVCAVRHGLLDKFDEKYICQNPGRTKHVLYMRGPHQIAAFINFVEIDVFVDTYSVKTNQLYWQHNGEPSGLTGTSLQVGYMSYDNKCRPQIELADITTKELKKMCERTPLKPTINNVYVPMLHTLFDGHISTCHTIASLKPNNKQELKNVSAGIRPNKAIVVNLTTARTTMTVRMVGGSGWYTGFMPVTVYLDDNKTGRKCTHKTKWTTQDGYDVVEYACNCPNTCNVVRTQLGHANLDAKFCEIIIT